MASNHHSIKAILYPNLLKNNKGKFKSQTISYQTLGINDICESFCSKSGSGVNPNAMEYHVQLFLAEMAELLNDGYAVNTGYFSASASIQGSFDSKNGEFDANKHKINFKFTQGSILRKQASKSKAEILHIASANYGIEKIIDTHSGSENNVLTPNGNLRIKGRKIKLMGEHPDVGLSFIDQASGERHRVSPSDIIINQNSALIILIPNLQPSTYQLELCTQYTGKSTPIIGVHKSTFAPILVVQ